MKYRSFTALIMAVVMCVTLIGSAMAAPPDPAADEPRGYQTTIVMPTYNADGSIVNWGGRDAPEPSYGVAIVGNDNTNNDALSWYNTGDDANQEGFDSDVGNDVSASIDIWSQIYDSKGLPVYKIDILWGQMMFVFEQETKWNPLTLRYEIEIERWSICEHSHKCTRADPYGECDVPGNIDYVCQHICNAVGFACTHNLGAENSMKYLGGVLSPFTVTDGAPSDPDDRSIITYTYTPINNEIRVTNRSDDSVTADFLFDFEEVTVGTETGNKFNLTGFKSDYDLDVDGHFFTSSADAHTASRWIKDKDKNYTGTDSSTIIFDTVTPLATMQGRFDRAPFSTTTITEGAGKLTLGSAARSDRTSITANPDGNWRPIDMPGVLGTLREPTTFDHTISNTEQSQSVFFAFTGRPDYDAPLIMQRGQSAHGNQTEYGIFEAWTAPEHRVGTIVITITPIDCAMCRLGESASGDHTTNCPYFETCGICWDTSCDKGCITP
jgi:hypothetical protein